MCAAPPDRLGRHRLVSQPKFDEPCQVGHSGTTGVVLLSRCRARIFIPPGYASAITTSNGVSSEGTV